MNQNTYSLVMAFCRPAAALIATLATMLGFAVDSDIIVNCLGGAVSVVLICYAAYKNNDYTKAAALGTEIMKVAKERGEEYFIGANDIAAGIEAPEEEVLEEEE